MCAGTPLLIKLHLSDSERRELLDDWQSFVKQHSKDRYQTQTPGRGNGILPLAEVWDTPLRIESGLNGETANPLRDWLEAPSDPQAVRRRMAQVQAQLDGVAAAWRLQVGSTVETKAFIAGRIEPGGGPTHYDEYDNLAFVLTGSKVFYHAPLAAFEGVARRGEKNERRTVNPFDELALNDPIRELHTTGPMGPLAPLWHEAILEAGDILFLPHRWWHWVWSLPRTSMTNVWIYRR